MNFQQVVTDLRHVMTLDEIAQAVGLHSKGAVHGIQTGRQAKVNYEVGAALVDLRKRMDRRIAKAAKEKK